MNSKRLTFWLFMMVGISAGAAYLAHDRWMLLVPPEAGETGRLISGGGISAGKAAELEEKVKGDPGDMDDRLTLLGYYFLRQYGSPENQNARDAHIFWVIQNHPDSKIAGMPYAGIDSTSDPGYGQARQLWLDQVQKSPQNPKILMNAAAFFTLPDGPAAEDLLLKGAALEPSNKDWPDRLGNLYQLEKDYPKAFDQFEKAYGLAANEQGKLSVLPRLAKVAVEAGNLDKAKQYAEELLNAAENSKFDWKKNEDLHDAYMVLGRVALRSGDLEGAKQYLLKAGAAPTSKNYTAFGPNMSLAKDLLEKGETDTVLQYFDLCSKFWDDKGKLGEWTSEVKAGKIPEFRGNLSY